VLWHVLVVVRWEGLATVEQHGCAQGGQHHAPLSALLLSAVHPVALYTHTPSQAPLGWAGCGRWVRHCSLTLNLWYVTHV
jgi:hypothetical protein